MFLVSKSSDKAEANVEAKQEPMLDAGLLLVDCCVALCIGAVEENSWDCSSIWYIPYYLLLTAYSCCGPYMIHTMRRQVHEQLACAWVLVCWFFFLILV